MDYPENLDELLDMFEKAVEKRYYFASSVKYQTEIDKIRDEIWSRVLER